MVTNQANVVTGRSALIARDTITSRLIAENRRETFHVEEDLEESQEEEEEDVVKDIMKVH